MSSFGDLPDGILINILEQLDTARDVSHFTTTTRQLHALTQQTGWCSFVRSRFPSMTIPAAGPQESWASVADRLTYLDRCWDRRGFALTVFEPADPSRGKRRGRRPPYRDNQTVKFQPVIDAKLLNSLHTEVSAWGAGEDLVVRWTPNRTSNAQSDWARLQGHSIGYSAGMGDITAVSIIERNESPEVVIGRADGTMQIVSVRQDEFGSQTQTLLSPDESSTNHVNPMRKSPGRVAISSMHWSQQTRRLASSRGSTFALYSVQDADEEAISPLAHVDLSQSSKLDKTALVRSLKFMGRDTIACALGGSRDPLRWGQIRPTGIEMSVAAKNQALLNSMPSSFKVDSGKIAIVRAIEPIPSCGSDSLLLSSWEDGTCRLMDLRTPSPSDAIYRNRFQPNDSHSSLLAFGSEKFLAGCSSAPDLYFFDFRHPKPYQHTAGLPCSADTPFPLLGIDFASKGTRARASHRHKADPVSAVQDGLSDLDLGPADRCDHRRNHLCAWHKLSQTDHWRPDASLNFGNARFGEISGLARASDLSDTIYCSVRGAVVEMKAALAEDVAIEATKATYPDGWSAPRHVGDAGFFESGVSRADCDKWKWSLLQGWPIIYTQQRQQPGAVYSVSNKSRLDSAMVPTPYFEDLSRRMRESRQ